MKRVFQAVFTIAGAVLGYYIAPKLFVMLEKLLNIGEVPFPEYIGAALGAIIIFFATKNLSEEIVKWMLRSEDRLLKMPSGDVLAGALGLIIGLIVAYLLGPSISKLPIALLASVLPFVVSAIFGYLGFRIGYKKRDDFMSVLSIGKGSREKEKGKKEGREHEYKVLDTSVIIDGRIADICRTGFLEGTLVIPGFVLEELQHIADSSDVLKRNRGRRGLDILNKIQKELKVKVLIYEGDFEDIQEVDSKLVKLAKVLKGKVVTNDFNLNKVCELQQVPVLNINDLANAVKPIVLPGEEIQVQVIKDGKEHGQGVAYLDDGTMIVVEGGRDYIGKTITVLVTSVLQTSAGRMIFAKPKLLEKAL